MEYCCSSKEKFDSDKSVIIEYLYLDNESCDRCSTTQLVLEEVIMEVTPTLELSGYDVDYRPIEIDSIATAKQNKVLSSPTIRVNGQDIISAVTESNCESCSDISGNLISCRVYEIDGVRHETLPKSVLAKTLLSSVYSKQEKVCLCKDYELPDNLKNFFVGKKENQCGCGGNCSCS